ncbi:DHA2 family efflux MFS transporter permease subunit [Corynebacterium liangguodongii]|uniref:MFS transporter n=1 Tax=Corynebacterium liangguodongii TaxID=2079535 RepID=A0A2S0WGY1_9CORY|nr:MFS transporter [Corynebacterium liangguodongii]PWB99594.1 MFS transporter [Corynebacterium liangguodongii]
MMIGFFMILLDSTIVSVAIPALAADLGARYNEVIWVNSAYLLAYAVPLLITGRLGDRFGPRSVYLAGLALFTASSLACGLAHSIPLLVAARIFQGLGGALLTPQTMSVMIRIFPPDIRGGAMGVWGATAGVATVAGPLVGGVLVDAAGWPWIFFVNVPIGVVGLALAWRFVPVLEGTARRLDWAGVAMSAVGMFCLIFGIQEIQRVSWSWVLVAAGLAFLLGFAAWQRRTRTDPLVPPALFRDHNYTLSILAIFAIGFTVATYAIPWMIYVQQGVGYTPTQAALLVLPAGVVSGALSPYIGRLTNTLPPKPFAVAGMALIGISVVLMALITTSEADPRWLLAVSVVTGLGNAMMWGPLSMIATRNLDPRLAGAGSSVYNTMRQVGSVIGSAAVAALMGAQVARHGSLSAAMGTSMLLPAAVMCLGAVIGTAFARTEAWSRP